MSVASLQSPPSVPGRQQQDSPTAAQHGPRCRPLPPGRPDPAADYAVPADSVAAVPVSQPGFQNLLESETLRRPAGQWTIRLFGDQRLLCFCELGLAEFPEPPSALLAKLPPEPYPRPAGGQLLIITGSRTGRTKDSVGGCERLQTFRIAPARFRRVGVTLAKLPAKSVTDFSSAGLAANAQETIIVLLHGKAPDRQDLLPWRTMAIRQRPIAAPTRLIGRPGFFL